MSLDRRLFHIFGQRLGALADEVKLLEDCSTLSPDTGAALRVARFALQDAMNNLWNHAVPFTPGTQFYYSPTVVLDNGDCFQTIKEVQSDQVTFESGMMDTKAQIIEYFRGELLRVVTPSPLSSLGEKDGVENSKQT